MKKILLGLVLSIGMSGVALAKSGKDGYNKLHYRSIETMKYNYSKGLIVSCTFFTRTNEYNICGDLVNSSVTSYTLPTALCGDFENGVSMKTERFNNGFGDCHPEKKSNSIQ
ncbi:hypothetical protein [Frigoriflavimonas asaccharolytica]|uniref:Uncharacterized protein n=1 Tax=Frigoriflavimonas asaccharolytica TaxID=2735899 RepID=A0A8J8G844_9FLAO|nr:hypothetical protein [Frigoriflavimonas asaccharolytica]NRS92706.1 hypothetical protein [Frigoriflavimonas asaccharolytica]